MMGAAGPGGTAAKGHILLVDDDEVFREATASVLRSAGYDVSPAASFRPALELLESDKPINLMVVDIVMPNGVNGLALARMARLRRPDMGILYLSGYDIPGLEHEVLGPVIRKPVDDDALIEAIACALQGKA